MIHLVRDPDGVPGTLITGPAARFDDRWDRDLTPDHLEARGLVWLDALEPLQRKAALVAARQRMERYPCFSDARMPILAAPADHIDAPTSGAVFIEHGVPGGGGAVGLPSDVQLRDLIASEMDDARAAHEPRDLFATHHHEMAHPLTIVLGRLPGGEEAVANVLSAALHREPPLTSLDDLTPADRLLIAQQVGEYAATATITGADDDPLPVGEDGMARYDAERTLNELCAEVAAYDTPANRALLPVVRGIGELLDALFGRASPLAEDLNQALFEAESLRSYLWRTRPAAVALFASGSESSWPPANWHYDADGLRDDPDLRWERENPHAPPPWLLDHLASLTGFERPAIAHHLMHAPFPALTGTDPLGNEVRDGSAWSKAGPYLRDAIARTTPSVGAAIEQRLRSEVERICETLRSMPPPPRPPAAAAYFVTHDGRIDLREERHRATDERLARVAERLPRTLRDIDALPGDWTPEEREALRRIAAGEHRAQTADVRRSGRDGSKGIPLDKDARGTALRARGRLGATDGRRTRRATTTQQASLTATQRTSATMAPGADREASDASATVPKRARASTTSTGARGAAGRRPGPGNGTSTDGRALG